MASIGHHPCQSSFLQIPTVLNLGSMPLSLQPVSISSRLPVTAYNPGRNPFTGGNSLDWEFLGHCDPSWK